MWPRSVLHAERFEADILVFGAMPTATMQWLKVFAPWP
jgi:hypothetical protein